MVSASITAIQGRSAKPVKARSPITSEIFSASEFSSLDPDACEQRGPPASGQGAVACTAQRGCSAPSARVKAVRSLPDRSELAPWVEWDEVPCDDDPPVRSLDPAVAERVSDPASVRFPVDAATESPAPDAALVMVPDAPEAKFDTVSTVEAAAVSAAPATEVAVSES
jgi:hypothetical protein